MAGTHGDLFQEIGSMVVAAHEGQAIDLTQKSEELARRYANLGVPADTIARAIARSMGAVGISMALIHHGEHAIAAGEEWIETPEEVFPAEAPEPEMDDDVLPPSSVASLFPSGLRLAVLS